jgi:hypothetical protein
LLHDDRALESFEHDVLRDPDTEGTRAVFTVP